MKITALRIGHFGKLHNVTIEPGDGLNLVMGDNESGKSTVFAFIGAMLFGLDKGRGRTGRDDLYTKYLPWDTPGAFQGSMDFTHEGRNYRVTRVFYNREKSCVFTDLDTGRKLETADDSISSIIPELTRQAWNNTVSMGQKNLRYADDFGDEVRNHIANLSMAGSDRVDVASALSELESRRKSLLKNAKPQTASQLESRMRELEADEREASAIETNIKRLKGDVAELDRQIGELADNIPDVDECARDVMQCTDVLDKALERLEQVNPDKPDSGETSGDATANENGGDKADNGAKLRNAGIVILAAGLLVAMLSNEKSAVGVGAGVVAMIVGLVCLMMALIKNHEIKKAANQTAGKTDPEPDTDNCSARLEKDNAELAYREARQMLENASCRLSSAKKTWGDINIRIEELEGEKLAKGQDIDRYEWQLQQIGDIASELEECERDLAEAKVREQEVRTETEALKIAADTITSLSDSLHDSFANDFNSLLSEEVSLATDGVYDSARISSDFEIEVMSGLDYVNADKLSGGAVEQIYLAFRFAAARLMFGGMEVPLLLDESFAYSDDSRLRAALSAIADREGQVFVFTCSSREHDMLDELGAAYKMISL